MRGLPWLALLALSAHGAILDRLAITVGSQVITEQQLSEEVRVTAFLNHEQIAGTEEARRGAADRLVQQLLMEREMQLSHYLLPETADLDKYLAEVQAGFGSQALFDQALALYGLTNATLKEHLRLQLTTLRFIEVRFRPNLDVSNSDIEEVYQREVTAWRATHPYGVPPTLAASRDAIRTELLEQRTDRVLDNWLEESRKQVRIVYLDKGLR